MDFKKQKKIHVKIYDSLPQVKGCQTGCNDCCGPVPITEYEAKVLGVEGDLTPFNPITLSCQFSSPTGCTVYENRPFLCRLFGSCEDKKMTCPKGARADKPLSVKASDILTARYRALK